LSLGDAINRLQAGVLPTSRVLLLLTELDCVAVRLFADSQTPNLARASSMTGVNRLTRFPSGSRNNNARLPPLIYFTDDDRVILVASDYGGTRHPAWYYNVLAHPTVTLCGGGFEGRFLAHEVMPRRCLKPELHHVDVDVHSKPPVTAD
jgi:deazaflavin-dependent oxidoreductase (nitroreductase family)